MYEQRPNKNPLNVSFGVRIDRGENRESSWSLLKELHVHMQRKEPPVSAAPWWWWLFMGICFGLALPGWWQALS